MIQTIRATVGNGGDVYIAQVFDSCGDDPAVARLYSVGTGEFIKTVDPSELRVADTERGK